MVKLSDHLDDITREFWQAWKTWRIGQGWTLGSDYPNQKLSPFLVANFEQLPDGGEWFRQHTALMLWALDNLPLEAWGVISKTPAALMEEAAAPRLRAEVERLRAEVEDLRKIVKLRELERDEAVAECDKFKSYKAPEPEPAASKPEASKPADSKKAYKKTSKKKGKTNGWA